MPQASRPQHRVLVEKDVPMTTRDGVTLRADVYRPAAPGRFPVLLSRLPYDKNLRRRPGDTDVFVEHGYVVIMQDTRGRFASDGDEYYPLVWEAQDGYDAVEWAAGLPYTDGQVGTMGQSYLGDYLRHPEDGPPWWQVNLERQHEQITVPMYHVTSWYDIFLHGGLANFCGLRERAMTAEARAAQKLLIGPWAHLIPYTSPTSTGTGEIDFGAEALIDLHEIQLRWFDHWLKGIDTGILDEPPVKIFVMGENRWRDEREWPLARTRYTPYFLHSGGRANSDRGDGVLDQRRPVGEAADRFVYDPDDPVPTRGGNTLILAMGVQDQRPVEARDA